MKKFALSLMVAAAAIFGTGIAAQASTYPPGATVSPIADPVPGETFTVTVSGCNPGIVITFEFEGTTKTATCGEAAALTVGTGTASTTFVAPTAGGTYSGTATGTDGFLATFSVTAAAAPATTVEPVTPPGGLPATGSGGTSSMTMIAIGLFGLGGGLLVVSQMRRRQTVPA
ncbi:MAG: LPXTG-motif cell wall-anchored protein [Ilumatobacter sp.]|jgi:LPXTG-motif cell wall-anchored protein